MVRRSPGLGRYEEKFRGNKIDFDVPAAKDLSDGDLQELGVPSGDRRRLLRAIAELGTQQPRSTFKPDRRQPGSRPGAVPSAQLDSAERRPITVMFCRSCRPRPNLQQPLSTLAALDTHRTAGSLISLSNVWSSEDPIRTSINLHAMTRAADAAINLQGKLGRNPDPLQLTDGVGFISMNIGNCLDCI